MKKNKSNTTRDRISALPDDVIHTIFSSMDMKKVIQTSILAKRWRYLCMSTPYINFRFHLETCKKGKKIARARFVNFVDRFLYIREDTNIHKFSLQCEIVLRPCGIHTWLIAAIRRNVQELSLELESNEDYFELPSNLFTSDIKVMKLEPSVNFQFVLPSTFCSTAEITSLEMRRVIHPDGDSNGDVVLIRFAVLKNQIIGSCFWRYLNVLSVSTPLLEMLEVVHLFDPRNKPIKLNLCTPKLKSFIYTDLYGEYNLGNLAAVFIRALYEESECEEYTIGCSIYF
ncbi:hypothetical protein IFM89_011379 [Coptis chinensis]|uniref:F-box domain-containing protein n=1 Tax=Coptis chinensis TaxID=261450 RepID=A0A835HME7_9MAGN|nr:hypothetical protein IFM89_011379 [Coptis chinensis]